jgi:hypothetical protein
MTNFIFSKEEAAKLFDDNISVKENKELIKKADLRFSYIMETMAAIIGRKFDWFDFDNENSSDNGNPIRGYFDPEDYSDNISFVGKSIATKNKDFDKYEYDFPTKWLWTNFEAELQEEVGAFEAKGKAIVQKRLDAENQVKDIAKSTKALQEKIYSNIPAEMRNNFSFKSPEQIYKERKDASNEELQAAKKLLQEQEDYLRRTLTPEEFEIIQIKKPEDLLQRKNSKKMKR